MEEISKLKEEIVSLDKAKQLKYEQILNILKENIKELYVVYCRYFFKVGNGSHPTGSHFDKIITMFATREQADNFIQNYDIKGEKERMERSVNIHNCIYGDDTDAKINATIHCYKKEPSSRDLEEYYKYRY